MTQLLGARMPSAVRKPIDTLRCTEAMLRAVIDELDRQEAIEASSGHARRRRHKRIAYPSVAPVLVEVQRPGEDVTSYLAAPRDISSSGMSLLIGMFLHPGAPCAVTLKTLHGEPIRIGSVIRRCRFVALKLHELGVRFNNELDINHYVAHAGIGDTKWAQSQSTPHAAMAIKTASLLEALRNGAPKLEIEELIRAVYVQCRDWVP